jgi:glucose/mannose transport system substrate-binding protein
MFSTRKIAGVSLALAIALAGCSSGGSDSSGSTDSGSSGGSSASGPSGEVEVFSWWASGGEAEGLSALVGAFGEQCPDVEFVNATVAGGAGFNAKAVLVSRLEAGTPPDSFQAHAGKELLSYIEAGQLEPIDFIYEEAGLYDAFPADLIEQVTYTDGNIYSVPVNIHRSNLIWWNPKVASELGITPPTTMDELFAALDIVKAAGATGLGLATAWAQVHLLESVLLSVLGVDDYNKLHIKGQGEAVWASAKTTEALEAYAKLLTYANADADGLDWAVASQYVLDGQAGFTVMGDWSDAQFLSQGLTPNVDYAWAPFPGTAGVYMWLSDSFTLSKNAPNRDASICWLKAAGSQAGQDAFNPKKGSIPARTDSDEALYGEYLQTALADWKTDKLAGSFAHGAVATNLAQSELQTAVSEFKTKGATDIADFQAKLAAAALAE